MTLKELLEQMAPLRKQAEQLQVQWKRYNRTFHQTKLNLQGKASILQPVAELISDTEQVSATGSELESTLRKVLALAVDMTNWARDAESQLKALCTSDEEETEEEDTNVESDDNQDKNVEVQNENEKLPEATKQDEKATGEKSE